MAVIVDVLAIDRDRSIEITLRNIVLSSFKMRSIADIFVAIVGTILPKAFARHRYQSLCSSHLILSGDCRSTMTFEAIFFSFVIGKNLGTSSLALRAAREERGSSSITIWQSS